MPKAEGAKAPLRKIKNCINKGLRPHAYLVNSNVVRACRFGGYVNNGANDGLSNVNANNAPSNSNANYGGSLCLLLVQNGKRFILIVFFLSLFTVITGGLFSLVPKGTEIVLSGSA